MYDNVGQKIKTITKIVAIVVSAISIMAGLVLLSFEDLAGFGVVLIFVEPIVVIVSSYFAYGFGEIVDTAIYLRQGHTMTMPPYDVPTVNKTATPNVAGDLDATKENKGKLSSVTIDERRAVEMGVCPECGAQLQDSEMDGILECPDCGRMFG